MGNFWQDVRHGFRALRKSPGFLIIAIVTLGLGVAVNTTIFSVVNGMILRQLPVPHPEEVTVLTMDLKDASGNKTFPTPTTRTFRRKTIPLAASLDIAFRSQVWLSTERAITASSAGSPETIFLRWALSPRSGD